MLETGPDAMTDVFPLHPPSAKLFWVMAGASGLMLALVVLFLWIAFSSRTIQFEIRPEGLRLRGDLWGRLVPAGAMKLEQARRADLRAEKALQPKWRMAGSAVGNYRSGWFKLRGGGKGLLYLTDPANAVLIPTTENYVILLSVADPDRFLARLREVCGR
jgi:hypothetical protein